MFKKNVILLSAADATEIFTPVLWASSKSYYELRGLKPDNYNWVLPTGDYLFEIDEIKDWIRANPPSVFGISLYQWNFYKAMEVAKWVKQTYPECIVISGGPQQYFKHDNDWFKNNPWLDASLPGDEYGERAIADLLDNIDEDGTVDWNQVNSIVYPSKSRDVLFRSQKNIHKKEFFWEYSPYAMQFNLIKQWMYECFNYGKVKQLNKMLIPAAKLETTRGCPYGCTYCDWGGGINSKVISKSLEIVEQDIRAISELNIWFCYICDANSGILGQRDIDVIDIFVKYKKLNGWPTTVHVGGLAKTVKAKDTIKAMLTKLAENELDQFKAYKIAIQTLDPVTQKNIDRTDVPIEVYAELAEYMKSNFGYRAHAEVIMGLPGQTIDNFYFELQEYARYDFTPQFYPWSLLPESPGYDPVYRQKFKIETVTKSDITSSPYYSKVPKNVSDQQQKHLQYTDLVTVCSTSSYTREEYAEMIIMAGLYTSLYYLGFFKYFRNSNLLTKEFFRSIWDNRNADNKFAQYLQQSHQEFLDWLDSPHGNVFYMKGIDPSDQFQYSLEKFWLQLMFLEPEASKDYFKLITGNDSIDKYFDQLITKQNYQTASNRYYKHQDQTYIRVFGKLISEIEIFHKPDDVFLIDNSQ